MGLVLAPIRFTRWLGRVFLWIFALPLGIFVSYRHGKKKDQKRLIEAIEKNRA